MAENIVESIIVKLGLDSSQYNREANKAISQNNKLNKSVGETDKVVGAVTGTIAKWFSVLAVGTGVLKLIDQVQKLNDELFFLEKNLGTSAQTLKAWQGAAGAMGGSASGMTDSMKSLNMAMNDFVVMGDTSMLPYMNALGVSMVDAQGKARDTDKVMLDLADSFSKMDREQAFSIASKMGIDEGTFNTLVQGRKEMEKMLEYQSKMYRSSEEELKASRQLAQNRALLGQHWESLKTMMANAIIPLFVKLSEVALGIFEYLQDNKEAVQAVFKGIATTLGIILIPMLAKATLAALAFIAPFAPFILVVGALGAAFGLLYDDYKVWAEGGKSLFDWSAFTAFIDGAKNSVDTLKNAFGEAKKAYMDMAITLNQKIGETETGAAFLERVGSLTAKTLAFFGNKDARVAVKANEGIDIKPIFSKEETVETPAISAPAPSYTQASGNMIAAKGIKNFSLDKAASIARVARNIGVNPNDLAAVISFETGGTFSPSAKNRKSTATGLIQFMEGSGGTKGKYYGMSREKFSSLSFDEQMNYVEKYFKDRSKNFRAGNEAKNTVADVYTAVTGYGYKDVPKYNKKGQRIDAYWLNRVWDSNKDGYIAKGEMVRNPSFHDHQKEYFKGIPFEKQNIDGTSRTVGSTQSAKVAMRQGDYINLSKVRENQAQANKANSVEVTIGDINVNTSSSTVTGTVTDALGAAKTQTLSLMPSVN